MDQSYQLDTTTTFKNLYSDVKTDYNMFSSLVSDTYVANSGTALGLSMTTVGTAYWLARYCNSGVVKNEVIDRKDWTTKYICTCRINGSTLNTADFYSALGVVVWTTATSGSFIMVRFKYDTANRLYVALFHYNWTSSAQNELEDFVNTEYNLVGAGLSSILAGTTETYSLEVHLDLKFMTLSGSLSIAPYLTIVDLYDNATEYEVPLSVIYETGSSTSFTNFSTQQISPFIAMVRTGTYGNSIYMEKVTLQ